MDVDGELAVGGDNQKKAKRAGTGQGKRVLRESFQLWYAWGSSSCSLWGFERPCQAPQHCGISNEPSEASGDVRHHDGHNYCEGEFQSVIYPVRLSDLFAAGPRTRSEDRRVHCPSNWLVRPPLCRPRWSSLRAN